MTNSCGLNKSSQAFEPFVFVPTPGAPGPDCGTWDRPSPAPKPPGRSPGWLKAVFEGILRHFPCPLPRSRRLYPGGSRFFGSGDTRLSGEEGFLPPPSPIPPPPIRQRKGFQADVCLPSNRSAAFRTSRLGESLLIESNLEMEWNWWREAGSNCRPTGYESVALTI